MNPIVDACGGGKRAVLSLQAQFLGVHHAANKIAAVRVDAARGLVRRALQPLRLPTGRQGHERTMHSQSAAADTLQGDYPLLGRLPTQRAWRFR
jgi:hypothetical protein